MSNFNLWVYSDFTVTKKAEIALKLRNLTFFAEKTTHTMCIIFFLSERAMSKLLKSNNE